MIRFEIERVGTDCKVIADAVGQWHGFGFRIDIKGSSRELLGDAVKWDFGVRSVGTTALAYDILYTYADWIEYPSPLSLAMANAYTFAGDFLVHTNSLDGVYISGQQIMKWLKERKAL